VEEEPHHGNRAVHGLASMLAVVLSTTALTAACSTRPHPATQAGPAPPGAAVPEAIRTFRSVDDPPAVPRPVRLRIPSIDVRTGLERLGKNEDQTVQVPSHWQHAGWYAGGPRPGEPGSAVLLGHVDSPSGPAVFSRVPQLRLGARVLVDRANGSTVAFRVTRVKRYPRARFPLRQVYWPGLDRELRLITCGGEYVPARGGYQDNVIVFAASR
jgi:Sortase domain